jgi:protein-tyrosine phosphatase
MRKIPGFSLWLGHAGDARDLSAIHEAGIVAVVDLALEEPPAVPARDLSYCRFPLIDGPGNPPWLLRMAIETTACLLRSGTPTLVACGLGMSRAPCIAAAALASIRGGRAEDVLAEIGQGSAADVSAGLWLEVVDVLPGC